MKILSELPKISDAQLMARLQAGEPEALAELMARYRPALVRVAASRLGRRDWAEDAVQETFLNVFKSRQSYDDRHSFRTWLWTIALNQCRRIWSQQRREPRVSSWSDETATCPSARLEQASLARDPLPLSCLLAAERSALLEQLLGRLPDSQADALRLRFFGELKFAEIAETMGCSLLTAKNRVAAGLLKLAEMLRNEESAAAAVDIPRRTADQGGDRRV